MRAIIAVKTVFLDPDFAEEVPGSQAKKTRMLISIVSLLLNLLVLDIMCLSSLLGELWPFENCKMYRNVLNIQF